MIRVITLTGQERDPLIHAIDLLDYGAEWPEATATKAGHCWNLAPICEKAGAAEMAESCCALATEFLESAKEVA